MKKNRHKEKKQTAPAENGTRDLVIANKVSGKVHGGLSRIRLSLAFRIALHYCIQLFRSFIPVALILTVLLCVFISYPVSRELKRMIPDVPETQQTEITNGYLSASLTETNAEKDFFPRIGQQFSVLFTRVFSNEQVSFYYSSGENNWLVRLHIHDLWIFWMMLMVLHVTIVSLATRHLIT